MGFRSFFAPVLGLILCAGCVQFEYEGASYAPVPEETVTICRKTDAPKNWEVIGTAVVSGVDQQISRESLDARLLEEAAARGAEMVAITSVEVLPEGTAADNRGIADSGILADPNDSAAKVRQEFDHSYGRASYTLLGKKVQPNEGEIIRSYRRMIRAEFLRKPPLQ